MKPAHHHCEARQHSDQMVCGRCGLAWDVNDLEPPQCPLTGGPGRASGAPPAERRKEAASVPMERRNLAPSYPPPAPVTERGKAALRLAMAILHDKTASGDTMPANPHRKKE